MKSRRVDCCFLCFDTQDLIEYKLNKTVYKICKGCYDNPLPQAIHIAHEFDELYDECHKLEQQIYELNTIKEFLESLRNTWKLING